MTTKAQAVTIVRRWVEENEREIDGYNGAFLVGSINSLNDEEPIPDTSDVDLIVVFDGRQNNTSNVQDKFLHNGVLIERAYCPREWFEESLVDEPNFACHFAANSIIDDPTGILLELHRFIRINYTKMAHVKSRCERLRQRILTDSIRMMTKSPTLYLSVVGHGMVVSGLAQLILLADLQNPTFKSSVQKARDTLRHYGLESTYAVLLEVLGAEQITEDVAKTCFDNCMSSFRKAVEVYRTKFFGDRDIRPDLKPFLMRTGQELISYDTHRESMLWITDTHAAFCIAVANDGTQEDKLAHDRLLSYALKELGIHSQETYMDIATRVHQVMPLIDAAVDDVINANSSITM